MENFQKLNRAEMKNVLGGVSGGGGDGSVCGTAPNCSTATCTASSGACKGYSGSCSSTNHGQKCSCVVAC